MRTPRGRVSARQRVSSAGLRLPQRQPAVQWYDPIQLLQTGVRVVLSAVFGAYADRREVQGAFPITKEKASVDDQHGWIVAAGVIQIQLLDFMRQLTTFRTTGGARADRNSVMARFGQLFLGDLWDVYARQLLTSSPL